MDRYRRHVVGVMGGHAHNQDAMALAEAVGRRIAEEGWILLNGGRNQGVMAASAKGCRDAGGFSVGIHPDPPGAGEEDIAPDLDLVIHTGMGYARNAINILSSEAVIVLAGSYGTLSEVTYAQTYKVPTVLLGFDDKGFFHHIHRAKDVDEAIAMVRRILTDGATP